jgi:S-formylglutathione hydrolase
VPWGQKALPRYLGDDPLAWAAHDAVALLQAGHTLPGTPLVDQGLADKFLESQLKPELLEAACAAVGQSLSLRRHAGYDHGYWFIQSFIEDHLRHHAASMGSPLSA